MLPRCLMIFPFLNTAKMESTFDLYPNWIPWSQDLMDSHFYLIYPLMGRWWWNKLQVQLLRTMLQWEEQLRSESITSHRPKQGGKQSRSREPVSLGEVVIVCWPRGDIMRLRSGSTAADAARRVGLEGKLVVVNGQLVPPNTELKDGDVVEVRL